MHYADLAVAPVWDAELGAYVLKSRTLNDFINWQNWPLDSTTSLTRTVHLLLYLPSRHVSPLLLLDSKSERLSPPAFMVAGHGAAYVLPDTSLSAPAPGSLGAHLTSAHHSSVIPWPPLWGSSAISWALSRRQTYSPYLITQLARPSGSFAPCRSRCFCMCWGVRPTFHISYICRGVILLVVFCVCVEK